MACDYEGVVLLLAKAVIVAREIANNDDFHFNCKFD